MKLWAFIYCPQCGFSGCAAPVDEIPCPRCGYADGVKAEPAAAEA